MKRFHIESLDSVYDFFYELYYRYQNKFDPANDLARLINKEGQQFFTKEEGEYLDAVMQECFIFCVLNDLNIYTVAAMVQCDIKGIKAAA